MRNVDMRDNSTGTEFRKLAAIMFTDMVGYSAMAQRNEALTLELLEEHRIVVRSVLPSHHGNEIKTMGDAFLVEFPSALAAVRCAIQIQKQMAERNSVAPPERQILLRIGIHLGDIVRRENDVVGDGVNIAARIEPLAQPGGICISEDVARQITNKVDQNLVRVGPGELKNIELPVVIYKLEPSAAGSSEGFSKRAIRPPTPLESARQLLRPLRIALMLATLVILGLIAGVALGRKPISAPSVAIIPFASLSSDRENEHLSDGLTEELISAFARIPNLQVPARSALYAYKGKNESASRIASALNVRHVLEGSVRKDGALLRISVQLVNAANGFQVWGETFEESATNTFALQQQIAQRVATAVRALVVPEEDIGGIGSLRAGMER